MLGSARSALIYKPSSGVVLPSAMAAYSFSEGSGLTTADSSGNGRTLTLNTVTWDANGHTGPGVTNSAATIGATANFAPPTAAITIMGWVKPLDLTAGTSHFAFGFVDSAANGRTIVAIYTQRADFPPNNVLAGNVRINDSLNGIGGVLMTNNTWAHTAVTYDGTNIRLYTNGSLTTTSGAVVGTITTADRFCVAGWTSTSQYDTDVVVDDVRVFNTALSQPQIALAMNTPV